MFSNADRSSADMMLPANPQESSAIESSWRRSSAARRRRGPSRRMRSLIGAIVSTCTLTGLLTWATTSIGPAPRVSLTLASTDYRGQLNLPINGFGDNAIGRFATWATVGHEKSTKQVRLWKTPTELATPESFRDLQVDPEASVALVYVSAHGVSSPRGPVLLAADATGLSEAVEVKTIIDQLAQCPESQRKVLLLDAVHFASHAPLGVIHNDFARQMRDLDRLIASVPNLVVVVSADVDQQSWISPDQGTTVWAAAMIDALQGNASDIHDDGWIDLFDVHQFASTATESSTRKFRVVPQTPLLLPLGTLGEERCRETAIFPASDRTFGESSSRPAVRTDRLTQWWKRHQEFECRELHPSVVSPVIWQQFEATLLRMEQFEFAGCHDAADSCVEPLSRLGEMLDRPTLVDSIACRAGVLGPELIGFDASEELVALARQWDDLLSGLSPEEARRQWSELVTSQPHLEAVAYLRRSLVIAQVRRLCDQLQNTGAVDRQRLRDASALMESMSDPIQPMPQVGLIVQLLARDLPSDATSERDAARIARWLELCLDSESITGKQDWWTPSTYPWIADLIQAGDEQRRFAGDLLFGDANARDRADVFLLAAEEAYKDANRIATIICEAEKCRSLGRAQVRRLSELASAYLTAAATQDALDRASDIVKIYGTLDQIDALMAACDGDLPTHKHAYLNRIVDATSQFERQFDEISSRLNAWQTTALGDESVALAKVVAALSVTGGTESERSTAWARLTRLATMIPSTDQSREPWPTTSNATQSIAAARGRITLAAWPASVFDQLSSTPRETKLQVQHRLDTFEADARWWESLAKVGEEIERRELALMQSQLAKQASNPSQAAWLVYGTAIAPIEASLRQHDAREQLVAPFLAWQAERYLKDGYWSFDQNGPAYCERVHELLISDSLALSQRSKHPDSLRSSDPEAGLSDDPLGIELLGPSQLIWTTQQSDTVSIRVGSRTKDVSGFAAMWAEVQGAVESMQPQVGTRSVRPLTHDPSNTALSADRIQDSMLITLRCTEDKDSEANRLNAFAYFRGRKLQHPITIAIADEPDVRVLSQPVPRGARVAVRTDDESSGKGAAVSLVLDCSGSMGAKPGQPFGPESKYAHAVDAVETLLDAIPTGTRLSIWTFGQAIGSSKTVQPAESTIRQAWSSIVWDAADKDLRKRVMDSISYPTVEPWNESPLLASMLVASRELKEHDGLRNLIVITDGSDNRIATDPVANPLALPADQWIRKQFNGTGITVNVIAFRVEPGDEHDTRKQLTTVETLLPPGRFVQIEQAPELAKTRQAFLSVLPAVELQRVEASGESAATVRLNLTGSETASAHWTEPLQAGLYRVRTEAASRSTLLEVSDGDQLVLSAPSLDGSRRRESSAAAFQLWPIMRHEYQWCPQQQAGRWRLAMEPIAGSDAVHAQRRLIAWSESPSDIVALQSPRELWIEATQDAKQGVKPLRMHWQASPTQPRSAFEVTTQSQDATDPQFKVWISDTPAIPVGSLARGREFTNLADLAPKTLQLNEGEARLLSAAIETHEVSDGEGGTQCLPCLVLRAALPPGTAYRLRTEGLSPSGFDEQWFTKHGHYTLRQWPITAEQVTQSLHAVHLVSIEQFKRDCERRGNVATFASDEEETRTVAPHDSLSVRERSQR